MTSEFLLHLCRLTIPTQNSIFAYYQSFIKVPIIKNLVNITTALGSRVILKQDKQVVITQQPPRSDYGMPEKLIHADRPIIEYRRHREELKAIAPNANP